MSNPQTGMTSESPPPYQPPSPLPYQAPIPLPPTSADSAPRGEPVASHEGLAQRRLLIIGGIALAVVLLLVGVQLHDDMSEFLGLGAQFIPFAALAVLAYAGRKSIMAMVFTYVALAVISVAIVVFSLTNLLIGYVIDQDKFTALLNGTAPLNSSYIQGIFSPSAGPGLLVGLLLYFIATLVAATMLLRPVRVTIARFMPIDPDDFVHKIALATITLLFLSCFIPLLVLGGKPPLLNLVSPTGSGIAGSSISLQPLDPIYQLIWTVPAVFLMAGWLIARRLPDLLKRLGLVRPTLQQVAFGLGFGVILALAGMLVIDPGINWVWQTLGWQTTNTAAFDQLLSRLITVPGAIIIGFTAGVGEELQFRGLLQPRIGLLASNLVFTGLHAFQYGVDGLLSVFIVGLILGIVRARSNTSTSAIVHGTYDCFLVLVAVFVTGS